MHLVLLAIAVISLIVAIIGLIFNLDFAIVLSFLTALSTLVAYLATRKPKEETEPLDKRNRRVMLDHVEYFGVKNILEKSLHGVALLELGIKEVPTAVKYPWTISLPDKVRISVGKVSEGDRNGHIEVQEMLQNAETQLEEA